MKPDSQREMIHEYDFICCECGWEQSVIVTEITRWEWDANLNRLILSDIKDHDFTYQCDDCGIEISRHLHHEIIWDGDEYSVVTHGDSDDGCQ
jgi:predicted RNA-binding Zn-ribbon protein involved in translation (DUF1610 family)